MSSSLGEHLQLRVVWNRMSDLFTPITIRAKSSLFSMETAVKVDVSCVLSAGIEPASLPSEGSILSIER